MNPPPRHRRPARPRLRPADPLPLVHALRGASWDWHLKSPHLAEWLQLPMLFVNRWRMDLIFLISGLSRALPAPARRRPAPFFAQRSWRLLLPLLFGMPGRGAGAALRAGRRERRGRARASGASSATTSAAGSGRRMPSTAGSTASPGTTCGTWPTCGATRWRSRCCCRCCVAPAHAARAFARPARAAGCWSLPALPLLLWTLTAAAAVRGHRRPDPRLVPPRDVLHGLPLRLPGSARDAGVWDELVRLRRHALACALAAAAALPRAGVRPAR